MARSDDLAPLLAARPPQAVGFRQGVVQTWDPVTYANTVSVNGATFTNVPVLNNTDLGLVAAGDVVAILTFGSSWLILGRVTVPS